MNNIIALIFAILSIALPSGQYAVPATVSAVEVTDTGALVYVICDDGNEFSYYSKYNLPVDAHIIMQMDDMGTQSPDDDEIVSISMVEEMDSCAEEEHNLVQIKDIEKKLVPMKDYEKNIVPIKDIDQK